MSSQEPQPLSSEEVEAIQWAIRREDRFMPRIESLYDQYIEGQQVQHQVNQLLEDYEQLQTVLSYIDEDPDLDSIGYDERISSEKRTDFEDFADEVGWLVQALEAFEQKPDRYWTSQSVELIPPAHKAQYIRVKHTADHGVDDLWEMELPLLRHANYVQILLEEFNELVESVESRSHSARFDSDEIDAILERFEEIEETAEALTENTKRISSRINSDPEVDLDELVSFSTEDLLERGIEAGRINPDDATVLDAMTDAEECQNGGDS